jgi:hypothetical protein
MTGHPDRSAAKWRDLLFAKVGNVTHHDDEADFELRMVSQLNSSIYLRNQFASRYRIV